MEKYHGRHAAPAGTYFNARQLSFVSLRREDALPGSDTDEYRRVPSLVMLVAAPLLGGLYVVFLPLIGFVVLAWVGASKLGDAIGRAVTARRA